MARSRTLALGVAAVLMVAGGGIAALAAADVVELPPDWWSGSESAEPPSEPEPLEVAPPPGLSLPNPRPAQAVLGPVRPPRTNPLALRARLTPVLSDPDLGRHAGVVVRDLVRGQVLLSTGGDDPYLPASTLKLFTATAVLSELGPDHRFTTSVVRTGGAGRTKTATIVLVGGGDPLLASTRAAADALDLPPGVTVSELATRAARSLRTDGVRRVRVGYDAGLFSGPAAAASWEPDYVRGDIVSPISALWVEQGRVGPTEVERSPDPALAAAETFAQALRSRGLTVLGVPRAVSASARAEVLVERTGAELDTVIEHVLEVSDNEGAEVLLRHVGLATGRDGSFSGGVAGVREVLVDLGVPWDGVAMYDGSGLSRADRVTRAAVAGVLQLGADPDLPDLRTVTTGLPVAHFNGSLAYRFLEPEAAAGRGLVRAKTGTLSHVHGLAGTVVTRDGALLGFALLTDRVPLQDTLDARALLDEMAAALAGCGCSR